ncbi:MAG: divergent polysaccharide deacetylase family protein, partial [Cellvibrionaceae bacterium]|nr:divergent polysaccharide deacetylase family protein [Cellvibrionaceae bacterium]
PNSQAHRIAQENRIPSATRHVFLDNSRKHQDILVQLEKAVKRAQRSGSAVVIGHPHPETLEVLERIGPALAKAGIEFVHASALISRTSSQNQLSKVDLNP